MSDQDFFNEGQENAHQERMQAFRKEFGGLDLHGLVKKMQEVRAQKDGMEAELKSINAAFDVLRFELIPSKMEETGVETVRYEGIGRVSLTADLRVTVKEKDNLFAWLKKHKMGDLIVPGINGSTLKAWLKGRIKSGKEYPSEYLNVTPITRASITKG